MDSESTTTWLGASSILFATAHRPWPLPPGQWAMTQTWNDLLFMHYAMDPQVLRALVPEVLTLDLYRSTAWLSMTPFWISNLRPPGVPKIPVISRFPELNVRTYVTYQGKPGVFFFSLDAGNLSAVWGARMFYRLPYWHAEMKCNVRTAQSKIEHEARLAASPSAVSARSGSPVADVGYPGRDEHVTYVEYSSKRIHGPKAGKHMPQFRSVYGPIAPVKRAVPGSLSEFLSERYCLYAWNRSRLYRAEIHHLPWPLQVADADVEVNTMAEPVGIVLPPRPDIMQFSRSIKVLVWGPERLL
jgi:uncharacterized protein